MMRKIKSKAIKSFDGTRINYNVCNMSNAFLVFLHGAGGDLNAWKEEREFFHKKGISTIAIDLRGHGLSDRPPTAEDYKLENFSKDVYHVIKKEKINNFVLVGHCFGGAVAITFHKLYPSLSKAYVLINTTYEGPPPLKIGFKIIPMRFLNNLLKNKIKDYKPISHVDFSKFVGSGDWNIKRIYSDIQTTSFRSWLFTYKNFANFDGKNILRNINKRILVIGGELDSIFKVPTSKRIKDLAKKSELVLIPSANHISVINTPKILSDKIFKFISSLHTFRKEKTNKNKRRFDR